MARVIRRTTNRWPLTRLLLTVLAVIPLVSCATGQRSSTPYHDDIAANLMTLTEDVRRQHLALNRHIEEGDALLTRYAELRAKPGGSAVEARLIAVLNEDDQAVKAEMTQSILRELPPDERQLAVRMVAWFRDFHAWGRRLTEWEAEEDRIRRQGQALRTELMVAFARDLPPTQQAYYMGLVTTLGDELKSLDQKYESMKSSTSGARLPR
jgi:hypothetical protein